MKSLFLLLVAALIIACSAPEEPSLTPISLNDMTGESLWNRISSDAPYENYSFWPSHEGIRPGQAPHGEFHRIYVNRTLSASLPATDRIAPNGSIIVKESLNASRELVSITVMAKTVGYNPEAGDWFWASYTPDGTVRVAGKPTGCIKCHEGMSDNDYVIVQALDAAIK